MIGGGKTYADLGAPQTALREQAAQAEHAFRTPVSETFAAPERERITT